MHDLRIRLTPSDGLESAGGSVDRHIVAIWRDHNIPATLAAILDGLESYGNDAPAKLVAALSFCPDLCRLASAVHGLHLAESDETPIDQAIAILTKLRDSRQPEAIRTRAGNLLIDIAEGDRDPIRDNIAGTRVRYLGDVESIKGKCGVLTGTKRTHEELGVECVEAVIDGLTWAIPCEFPQFEVVTP